MSKRIIVYVMALGGMIFFYCKRRNKEKGVCNKAVVSTSVAVLHNVSIRPINGMDPVRLEELDSFQVVCKVYEGLYEYHYLKRPFELVANLAEGMPVISPDGLVYTFKIKKGLFFQDDPCFPNGKGRELKAVDFVFTLKRIVDPKNKAPFVDFIDGMIKGLDSWKQLCDYAQDVEGLQALDDYTFQVTLTKPWPCFLNFLAMWPSFVVAKEAVMHYGLEFLNHPVGTGPFILPGGFDPQSKRLAFVKNPTFREKLFPSEADPQYQHMLAYAGKKLPLLDKVVTHIITEEQPRWLGFQTAAIDVAQVSDSAIALAVVKDDALLSEFVQKGMVLYQAPGANTEFFAFNHSHALFKKNLYLRQAIAMAFDRDTYNQMFYHSRADVAQSLVPPIFVDRRSGLINPCVYNLERARAYLVKAGYPGGQGLPVITLDTRTETTFKNKADFFAKCMAEVGIQVEVITNLYPALCKKMRRQATMMHALQWCADYPDPSSFFQIIKSKDLVGLQYENLEFNALLDKAALTANREERSLLYAALDKLAAEQVPMIYAVYKPIQFLYYNYVKNFVYNSFNLALDQYIAVDMAEKAKLTVK